MKITGIALLLLVFLVVSSGFSQTINELSQATEIVLETDSSDVEGESVTEGCCPSSSDCAAALQTLPPLPEELEALKGNE